MASFLTTTTSAAKVSPSGLERHRHYSPSKLSFPLSLKPKLRFSSKVLQPVHSRSTVLRAELNKVAVYGSSNAAAAPTNSALNAKDGEPSNEHSPAASASEESISEFIAQVASLVKLVDSRDIVELQLKQLDCEVTIRKKEALPQSPSNSPVVMMNSLAPPPTVPQAFQTAPPAAAPAPTGPAPSAPPPVPSTPPVKSAKSSLPPLKCPMAGTFYRSSAPSEPPFVKVGDKVQKGQVVCIIEAMKLMNEIEADQSGTIVEILADDGKSVSVDTPLFVIEP